MADVNATARLPLILAVLFFVAATVVYTFPLALHPGALLLAGVGDHPSEAALIGWTARQLLHSPGDLFDTEFFYPYSHTEAYWQSVRFGMDLLSWLDPGGFSTLYRNHLLSLRHSEGGLFPGFVLLALVVLEETAARALRSVGAREDLRGRLWVSHVVIGVRGAAAGEAVERAGPALLRVSAGLSRQLETVLESFELR